MQFKILILYYYLCLNIDHEIKIKEILTGLLNSIILRKLKSNTALPCSITTQYCFWKVLRVSDEIKKNILLQFNMSNKSLYISIFFEISSSKNSPRQFVMFYNGILLDFS